MRRHDHTSRILLFDSRKKSTSPAGSRGIASLGPERCIVHNILASQAVVRSCSSPFSACYGACSRGLARRAWGGIQDSTVRDHRHQRRCDRLQPSLPAAHPQHLHRFGRRKRQELLEAMRRFRGRPDATAAHFPRLPPCARSLDDSLRPAKMRAWSSVKRGILRTNERSRRPPVY